MAKKTSRTAAGARIELPETLDASAAPALADRLRAVRGGPLTIDASGVRRLGGLCAQVLLSAAASWRADGAALRLDDPSAELVESLGHMGLDPESLTAGDPIQ